MSATIWSRFFWADWLRDTQLRRCSPAARALWIDMLCLAAQGDPIGYLADGDDVLGVEEIARMTGFSKKHALRLVGELERRRVFSRDDKGRIYSRRMVRDADVLSRARRDGVKGGNPNVIKERRGEGVNPPDNPPVIPHKPESKSHRPESMNDGARREPLSRAAAALGVQVETLRRRTGWIILGDMIEGLAAEGCDVERDVWPTIARVAKRLSETPATPLYFKTAILDARDRRRASEAPQAVAAAEWQDRLAVFAAEGVWSTRWGPKPGEAGCLAPDQT